MDRLSPTAKKLCRDRSDASRVMENMLGMPRRRHLGNGVLYDGAKVVGKLTMAEGSFIGQDAFVAGDVVMKRRSQINPHGVVVGKVVLGPYAVVGYGACVIASTYTTSGQYMCEWSKRKEEVRGMVVLEKGAYVGANAVICVCRKNPTVIIGERAAVGALTYVDRDVPAHTVVHAKAPAFSRSR